jgi:diaminopimelate epimerase
MFVTKYNANGNDFVIFHDSSKKERHELAKLLCDRHAGVGADGMVVLVPHPDYDFEWEFYNSDGSEATMCGNATRAAAHYAVEKGISVGNRAVFLTGAGVIRAEVNGFYVISDMLPPRIMDREIYAYGLHWWLIDTGVPHLVAPVEDLEHFDLDMARDLRQQYDANVNIYVLAGEEMRLRTYERGVENETLACGTGITACYVRSRVEGKAPDLCPVFPRSGDELYMEEKEGKYRFGGRVSKSFIAELTMEIPHQLL